MAALLDKLFNTDKRELAKIEDKATLVENWADKMTARTDEQLKAETPALRQQLADGKSLDDIMPEAFAAIREAARRVIGEYAFHVQVMGGIVYTKAILRK
jgi:preprotein translocase subunit SecA